MNDTTKWEEKWLEKIEEYWPLQEALADGINPNFRLISRDALVEFIRETLSSQKQAVEKLIESKKVVPQNLCEEETNHLLDDILNELTKI